MREDDDRVPRDLQRSVEALREMPDVRPEWLASIASLAAADHIATVRTRRSKRQWSFDPIVAIAAGIACLAVGAGGMYVALDRHGATKDGAFLHNMAGRVPSAAVASVAASVATAPVRFTLVAPAAVNVQLVGDFNAWNPVALPMRRSRDGSTWEVEVGLAPGRYTYAFVVDGRVARDPSAAQAASDDFGVPSSVLLVKGGGT